MSCQETILSENGFSAFLVICDTELAPYTNKFYFYICLSILFTYLSIETISLFVAVLSFKVATNTDLVNTESLFLGEIQS